jgi:hypothetical protein
MAGTPADFTRIRQLLEQLAAEVRDLEATAYQPQPGHGIAPSQIVQRVLPLVTIGLAITGLFIGQSAVLIPVTLAALGCAFYVIRSRRYSDADRNWAYGAVGMLIAYWVRTW